MKKMLTCFLAAVLLCCSLAGCGDENLTENQKHQKEIKKTAVECTIDDLDSRDGYCLIKGKIEDVQDSESNDDFYSGTVTDKNGDTIEGSINKELVTSAGVKDISKCKKFYGKLTGKHFTIFYLE